MDLLKVIGSVVAVITAFPLVIMNCMKVIDYFSNKKIEHYVKCINITNDLKLKKELQSLIDWRIMFSITGINDRTLSAKVIELINSDAGILYKRDLYFYRDSFVFTNDTGLTIRPIGRMKKASNYFFKFLACFYAACFIILSISLIVLPNSLSIIIGYILWSIFYSIVGICFLLITPRNNQKKMNELLTKFNHTKIST